ncbi:hypothetical protein FHS43_006191 [Streptosporangium becharense]|uniref:Lipoprotein n=1 Tax=Streptosporangium becharense TaxID=1816182 RepID=A0A7W9IH44_9ACTN|nr:hypothetical protein [Streptosporangium becharense]MBB2914879.1 hypothetical protein [Streptosporangium becharense]MBB5820310.1 hypothetical protein [Streptosporangium becharense]
MTRPLPLLLALAFAGITATACGSSTSAAPTEPPPATETTEPTPEPAPSDPDRTAIDPASVKITECEFRKEDYGGGTITYGVESTAFATNTTKLTGTLSLHLQYQAADGTAIAESIAGANNIKPGQRAKISDSAAVEADDLPGGKVKCVVISAEVYLVKE